MPKRSAGLLPYRRVGAGGLDLFLVHPGGPLWVHREEHAWSVAKGGYDETEDAVVAAEREFIEEVGAPPPPGPRIDLGEVRQSSGKWVRVWAVEAGRFEVKQVASNHFDLEWPPRSGRHQRFPEVDRAEWMSADSARRRLVKGQIAFVDRLVHQIGD